VERSFNDTFWGDGGNGRGQNRLGRILMELREELERGTSAASSSEEETASGTGDVALAGGGRSHKSHTTNAERVAKRRNRNRGRKEVWKDDTGDSKFEIDNENPTQAVLFTDSSISVPLSALPAPAKRVLRHHQYVKKFYDRNAQVGSDEDEEEEEEIEAVSHGPTEVDLGAYLPPSKANRDFSSFGVDSKAELLMADSCISVAKNTIALMDTLSPLHADYAACHTQLSECRSHLQQFVGETQHEDVLMDMLGLLDRINAIL